MRRNQAGNNKGRTGDAQEEDGLGGEAEEEDIGHEEGGRLRRGRPQDAQDALGRADEQLDLVQEGSRDERPEKDRHHLQKAKQITSELHPTQ